MSDDAYIGEIRIFPYDWAQEGWMPCDGRELPVDQYQALYSIIENTYGGKSPRTFRLPDLRGLAVMGPSRQPGDGGLAVGASAGAASVALNLSQLPTHTHDANAYIAATGVGAINQTRAAAASAGSRLGRLENATPNLSNGNPVKAYVPITAAGKLVSLSPETIAPAGTGAAHENRQPFCVMNFCICVDGEYPVPSE